MIEAQGTLKGQCGPAYKDGIIPFHLTFLIPAFDVILHEIKLTGEKNCLALANSDSSFSHIVQVIVIGHIEADENSHLGVHIVLQRIHYLRASISKQFYLRMSRNAMCKRRAV